MEKETKLAKRESDVSPASLMQQALAANVTPEVMEKFMNLYDRWEAKKGKKEFDEAMSALQGEMPVIDKGKPVKNKDGSLRYKYAPLDVIVKQVGKLISKHGLSYTVNATVKPTDEGKQATVCATVIVTHEGGHSQESSFVVPLDVDSFMNAAQKFGSALTYAKRYAFCNAFGILTGDPDTDANDIEPANTELYMKAQQRIGGTKTLNELFEIKASLEAGRGKKLYSTEQRDQLLRQIDVKTKEFASGTQS